MNTLFADIVGWANKDQPLMVFDWEKAAKRIKEANPTCASAGLCGDWEWTSRLIWSDGKPIPREDTHTHLASRWAVPELEMDGEVEDCFRMQKDSPGWNSKTYWPPEALKILEPTD